MKKMWMIAAVACAALMISCGGEKKDEKKAEAAGAATAAVVTPEAKAAEMVAKLQKASSESEAEAIAAPYESYYNSLSAADKAKFDNVLKQAGL